MNNDSSVRYIDTETASVKMTGGVPFKVGEHLGSDSDSEDDVVSSKKEKGNPNCMGAEIKMINGTTNFDDDFNSHLPSSGEFTQNASTQDITEDNTRNDVTVASANIDSEESRSISLYGKTSTSMNSFSDSHSKSEHSTESHSSLQTRKLSKSSDIFNNGAPQDIPSHMLINTEEEHMYTNHRFNPFNQIPMIDEDHFSDNYFQSRSASYGSSSRRSSSQNVDGVTHPGHDIVSDISFAELGLAEDHFSHPQGHFGLSGVEELELAIDNCKDMIREAEQGSEKQKNLVLKLVQLRIKLQEIKDGPEPVADDVKVILSHKMVPKSSRTSKYYCERCNGVIWGMLQYWYRCSECGYRCHEKCLQQILRTCAKAKVIENQPLIMEISPKESNDLASQTYRCAECRSAISFKTSESEARLCDYSGRYYCEFCHWNDSVIIPARVLHNWDFHPRKVARSSKQFLKLMQQKAVIRIQDINPMLFVYVDQLNEIKKLREEMMVMKKYIISCPSAMAAKLLLLLEKRQHFVESSDKYSMQDLLDAEEVLLPELVSVHSTWAQHIKVDCELCQGRGFCCELCNDKDILFPFDNIAVVCAKCSNVLHRHCFAKKSICPRCERRDRRSAPQ